MRASRRIWILLAALAILAGFLFATSAPAPAPGTTVAERTATPTLPSPASDPIDATAAPLPAPATTGGAVRPPTPPTPARPHIGSEGYGPHIERAQAGNDAAAAWESVKWLRQCANHEGQRYNLETLRNQGVSPEMMTQLMVETDAEARRCQTVTDRHRALLPELATRAMRAGLPEAASAYAAEAFHADLSAAQRKEVADAMRRDALAGHATSLLGALLANEAWGLSDAERLAFLTAYTQLEPGAEAVVKPLMDQGAIRLKAPPTPAQLAAAQQAAQQIIERARAGKPS